MAEQTRISSSEARHWRLKHILQSMLFGGGIGAGAALASRLWGGSPSAKLIAGLGGSGAVLGLASELGHVPEKSLAGIILHKHGKKKLVEKVASVLRERCR